jgi:hypothetical protein
MPELDIKPVAATCASRFVYGCDEYAFNATVSADFVIAAILCRLLEVNGSRLVQDIAKGIERRNDSGAQDCQIMVYGRPCRFEIPSNSGFPLEGSAKQCQDLS